MRSGESLQKKLSKSFLARADEACFWESYVASLLCRNGFLVEHNPMEFGEFHDPIGALTRDLTVYYFKPGHPGCVGTGLEVKSRHITFNGPDDYKWPTVRVCAEKWFKKNWPTADIFPVDFFIVSSITGAIVWVPAGTKATFGNYAVDTERNEKYLVVECSKEDLRSFEEYVRMIKESNG